MATPARRRTTRRPNRRPRSKAARRRAREQTKARLVGAALALAVLAAVAHEYPVTTAVIGALAVTAGTLTYLARTGRLHLPARAGQVPSGTYAHSIAAYQAMDYTAFEHAMADLARRDPNVRETTVSGGKNDRGLDVLIHLHNGDRYLLQCKRWKGRVGSEEVMKINGTYRDIHGCVGAAIITTSAFTMDAQRTNAMLPAPLRLIDGRGLARWASGGRPPWA